MVQHNLVTQRVTPEIRNTRMVVNVTVNEFKEFATQEHAHAHTGAHMFLFGNEGGERGRGSKQKR